MRVWKYGRYLESLASEIIKAPNMQNPDGVWVKMIPEDDALGIAKHLLEIHEDMMKVENEFDERGGNNDSGKESGTG